MIYKSHLIELYVNGQRVEFESQDSLNIRFQNVLYDPSKISSTQAEYSFEFELPCSPMNNKIFDYANSLAKVNKFRSRWNAELYADGNLIFKGTLTLNSVKNRMYSVNLVSVKVYSLDEIFGEDTMNMIKKNPNGDKWEIPFVGGGFDTTPYTIDWYNSDIKDVCFPLISYGVFVKDPISKDDVGSEYTSKFDLDKYNRWYMEAFYPSVNMVETLRKAFEWKGYHVDGDLFQDEVLNQIYMSVNLADGQDPLYNIGLEKFGMVDLNVEWETALNGNAYIQDLNFPYFRIGGYMDVDGKFVNSYWNFESIQVYDMLSEGNVTMNQQKSYMYQPSEHVIVIPADGFYKIELSGSSSLITTSSFQAMQKYKGAGGSTNLDGEVEIPVGRTYKAIRKFTPFEVQLVRNYDDNIELIHGVNNFQLYNGVPLDETYAQTTNYWSTYCCFPHEKLGSAYYFADDPSHLVGALDSALYVAPTDITRFGDETNRTLYDFDEWNNVGYIIDTKVKDNVMGYDPSVSPIFICGFTSMGNDNGGGCASVIKNGYSWSPMTSERYYSFYPQDGYYKAKTEMYDGSVPIWNYTMTPPHTTGKYEGNHGDNECYGTDSMGNYFAEKADNNGNPSGITGSIQCIVRLNKGDKLQLFGVQRHYEHDGDQCQYKISSEYRLRIRAYSPKNQNELISRHYSWTPFENSDFDENLNIPNFFNKEKKVSEWIQNVVDAFNLELTQDGKNVSINVKNKKQFNKTAVNIDDRVNGNEAESSAIDYPRSMAVKYKIDEDEWGAERSAVLAGGGDETILDDDSWKKLIDRGYDEIILNDDTYVTNKSEKNLQFSYTWYDDFKWYEVDADGQQNPYADPVDLRIPCISKYSYMIDGYDYEESEKHDGYGLAQRFWFKPTATECFVWLETYPKEKVTLYKTSNVLNNINLSYKTSEKSLLDRYFNTRAYLSSNYVKVEVYITADEYNRLKNGANVRFDKDIYEIVEISGYDPSGAEPTELKLMKRTI